MGKVSDLSREWDRALGVTRSFSAASLQFAAQAAQLRKAEAEDAAAHAAELEAKDRRIAELEAELAKRELPPLPDLVEGWMESTRRKIDYRESITCGERAVYNLLRELYPAPVPQWELDARLMERVGKGSLFERECEQAAARIREAGRGNSK